MAVAGPEQPLVLVQPQRSSLAGKRSAHRLPCSQLRVRTVRCQSKACLLAALQSAPGNRPQHAQHEQA